MKIYIFLIISIWLCWCSDIYGSRMCFCRPKGCSGREKKNLHRNCYMGNNTIDYCCKTEGPPDPVCKCRDRDRCKVGEVMKMELDCTVNNRKGHYCCQRSARTTG